MNSDSEGIILTGDRPTGRLHLGHFVGSLKNRVDLQHSYKQYVMVADVQALTDNADNPEKVRSNVLEVTIDNLAVGVDSALTTFFIQSQIPEIAELTVFFFNLVTLARLRRNPTVKDEMNQKGYGDDVPVGFLTYPISQTADILVVKADTVPVGEDQLPVLEQANEIVEKFNRLYGNVFTPIKPLLGPRLKGMDGNAKMGKSLGNALYLSDPAAVVEEKVMTMYTDPLHVRSENPGHLEGNVVFDYLDAFDTDTAGLAELKAHYQKGGVGDREVKKRLVGVLETFLTPIRKRRSELEKDPQRVAAILEEGRKKVAVVAQETLKEMRKAMKIDY